MRVVTSGPEVASSERIPQRTDKIIILLSSVGSSERLLTARSLVRVQQGEPKRHSIECLFFALMSTNAQATAAGYYRKYQSSEQRAAIVNSRMASGC